MAEPEWIIALVAWLTATPAVRNVKLPVMGCTSGFDVISANLVSRKEVVAQLAFVPSLGQCRLTDKAVPVAHDLLLTVIGESLEGLPMMGTDNVVEGLFETGWKAAEHYSESGS